MSKQLSARVSSLELQQDLEFLNELAMGLSEAMALVLSRRPEWAEQLRTLGHPRKWPENLGRWKDDAGDYEILDDLYCEWLELPEGSSAFVVEPWYVGTTRDERMQRSYLRSYHGADWNYSAGLSDLIAMRSRWTALHKKYGHPKHWPENAGRWADDEHDGVVTEHMALEWQDEWKRGVEHLGRGWFLLRRVPLPRSEDAPSHFHELLERASPRRGGCLA